jgi:predicted NBD/HSP70 family sugar kinase
VSRVIGNIPVIIENDACLAGLAEANALIDEYQKILYFTISTGIGGAWLENGRIAESLQDMEPGHMPLWYEDKFQKWESFASGKAIIARYGKQASEIQQDEQWQEIGERIAYGVAVCCSVLMPEIIVFGGGAGQFADKFTPYISEYLDEHLSPLVKKPKKLLKATYEADSAIHGCFELLRQKGLVK